jgi:hypothetical protein
MSEETTEAIAELAQLEWELNAIARTGPVQLVNNKKGRPRRQNKAALLLIMRIITADAFDFVPRSQSDSNTRRTLK